MWTKCTKLFTENVTEYFVHAQTVGTRPLLGGRGPGDKAKGYCCTHLYLENKNSTQSLLRDKSVL